MGTFYTQHILERMEERWVTRLALETVWKLGIHKSDQNWKVVVNGTYEKKSLRVIAKKKGKHFILVTAYFYD